MLYFSIALVIISTEIILAILYWYKIYHPDNNITFKEVSELAQMEKKIRELEDQVSSIRVAQGMRRRDG